MADLPDFPRHWHFARAIVEACRHCGEDPIKVANGANPSRARPYAYWALRQCFPRPLGTFIVAGLGKRGPSSAARVHSARRKIWWRHNLPALIGRSVMEQAEIVHIAPAASKVAAVSGLVPASGVPVLSTRARIIDRRVHGTVDLGDPPPGRSALDQRRASQ